MRKQLTQWFDGKTDKPVRAGVYQTKVGGGETYQYWDGKRWGLASLAVDSAYHRRTRMSMHQSPMWRGIAMEP